MKFLAGCRNGLIYALVGLSLFGFIACGIDSLTGNDTIFIRSPESHLADVHDATASCPPRVEIVVTITTSTLKSKRRCRQPVADPGR